MPKKTPGKWKSHNAKTELVDMLDAMTNIALSIEEPLCSWLLDTFKVIEETVDGSKTDLLPVPKFKQLNLFE